MKALHGLAQDCRSSSSGWQTCRRQSCLSPPHCGLPAMAVLPHKRPVRVERRRPLSHRSSGFPNRVMKWYLLFLLLMANACSDCRRRWRGSLRLLGDCKEG